MLKYILDRAKERSTWLGITGFVTAIGVSLSPDQAEAIIAAGVAAAGLVSAFTADSKGEKTVDDKAKE